MRNLTLRTLVCAMPRSGTRGFSLLELMVALTVIALLAAAALPSFTGTMRRMQVTSGYNDLLADIKFAQAEALKRGYAVGLYSTSGSNIWSNGWRVAADSDGNNQLTAADTLLRQHDVLPTNYQMFSSGPGAITTPLLFNSQGQVILPSGNIQVYFVVCNPDGVQTDARTLQISPSGATIGIKGNPSSTGATCAKTM